jgi:hypothetical protein
VPITFSNNQWFVWIQGLTLSGCEQESSNAELATRVREKDGNIARAIYVASDTAGSLYTGAPDGGMVVIAGKESPILYSKYIWIKVISCIILIKLLSSKVVVKTERSIFNLIYIGLELIVLILEHIPQEVTYYSTLTLIFQC